MESSETEEELAINEDESLDGLFEYATEHVQQIAGILPSEDLLFFYGRYKQAVVGSCNTDKPSFFDFKGKEKWNAWKALGDISQEQAKDDYVQKLCSIDPGWLDKVSSGKYSNKSNWAAVSSMINNERQLEDHEKTFVDYIKEGDVEKFRALAFKWSASDVDSVVNYRDENGLGVLHWAADRGNKDIMKLLLDIKDIDVNQKDNEGQTALHYACSNGHLNVVRLLIDCPRVNKRIRDNDNLLPEDIAVDTEVINLMHEIPY